MTSTITRRTASLAIASAGAALTATAGTRPASAATGVPKDISSWSLDDQVLARAKQQGRTDEGRVIWQTRGIIYGFKAPESPVPLVRFKGCEQQWWEPQEDGSFLRYTSLLTYYSDVESDRLIRTLKNPMTGETVKLRENWSRVPEGQEISKRGVIIRIVDEAFPDFYANSSITDIGMTAIGDTVSFQAKMSWPEPLVRRPYNQDNTFFASFADLADPEKSWIPSHGAGHILMPSMPNIGMNDPELGQVLWHVEFYKVESLNTLPDDYLDAAMADYGDAFEVNPKYDTTPSKLAQNLARLGYLKRD